MLNAAREGATRAFAAGRPEVPPAWVFGPWKSRDWQTADQAGIREDVETQHELGLPATVKLIDARWEVAYHTFDFDPNKFPDAQRMIDEAYVPELLAIMLTAGFYDGSGYWSMTAGLPAKTGVGGGIVILIIGILAGISIPKFVDFRDDAQASAVKKDPGGASIAAWMRPRAP